MQIVLLLLFLGLLTAAIASLGYGRPVVKIALVLVAGALLLVLLYYSRGALLVLAPLALPWLQRWLRARAASAPHGGHAPHRSTIATRYLRMSLDHASGELEGEVIRGGFVGRALADLVPEELHELWLECRHDPQSAAVLENYLDRMLPDWQQRFAPGDDDTYRRAAPADGPPDRREALAILGLADEPDREQIIAAHRRLMQRLHPDHGGSDYLAARVNAAKQRLLDDLARQSA